ncbi:electron transfer flavoprotein subunit alpha/FixB family protein [Paraburkholderia sp.]|uniref:electron transfer flavoprotein subunit alpha/FixB family protein n=1 Tax=Paraburkholderia sp. TaxID=1926495 RepID=UPI003C7ECDBE
MTQALIIAEHRHGKLLPITKECVSAATSLNLEVTVAVIGQNSGAIVESATCISGVTRVLRVDAGSEHFDSDSATSATVSLVAKMKPRLVLAGNTAQSMSYFAAAAAKCGTNLVTDTLRLSWDDDVLVAERTFYESKVHGQIELAPGTSFVTLRDGVYEEAEDNGHASVESVTESLAKGRVTHQRFMEAEAGDTGIETAGVILAVGRGIGEQEQLERYQLLAEKMGVAFAVSRPIVDAGWAPASRQVGQSGKSVAPKVYLALGISGATQHLAGIKKAETVIAINTDPSAGIFSVAKYGAYCDIGEVAEELESLLA